MIGMQAVLVAVLAVEGPQEERLDASEFFSIVLLT